jgi:homospermidine synthase
MLKRLAWLSVQYHDKVTNGYTDWEGLFSHDFYLFDEIKTASPWQVAQSMTAKDQVLFGGLCYYNDFDL